MNGCWNFVYKHLFGFHKWKSVRGCISGLGRLDFVHFCQALKAKFYVRIAKSKVNVIEDVYWAYFRCRSSFKNKIRFCVLKSMRFMVFLRSLQLSLTDFCMC